MKSVDVAIIGAGIAGASVAWALGRQCRVLLIEREAHPGYHTTGRSAAFYAETYGGPRVQPLTTASRKFFANAGLLRDRGALYVAQDDQRAELDAMLALFDGHVLLQLCAAPEIAARAPMLRPAYHAGGIYDAGCKDIDVSRAHALMLQGAEVMTQAQVLAMSRAPAGWQIETTAGPVQAAMVVNASGAWGDAVAAMAGVAPIGLQPRRRTIVTFAPGNSEVDADWPLVLDIAEQFYFKPEGGLIWASPADETPMAACDVQADGADVALTLDRLRNATDFNIAAAGRAWAGLRSFTADRLPVYGFDAQAPGFYWCVGQGGWGIQTAPAAGQLCAAQLLGQPLSGALVTAGVDPERYAPGRFAGR